MTALATSRKHVSTRCVRTPPGPIHRPGRSLLIRATPAPVSAATMSRPCHPWRHHSPSMRSDVQAPEHGELFASQASAASLRARTPSLGELTTDGKPLWVAALRSIKNAVRKLVEIARTDEDGIV